jgi:hypothetical protein
MRLHYDQPPPPTEPLERVQRKRRDEIYTRKRTGPKGGWRRIRIKSSLSTRYLRKEIYIAYVEPITKKLEEFRRPHSETQYHQISQGLEYIWLCRH